MSRNQNAIGCKYAISEFRKRGVGFVCGHGNDAGCGHRLSDYLSTKCSRSEHTCCGAQPVLWVLCAELCALPYLPANILQRATSRCSWSTSASTEAYFN